MASLATNSDEPLTPTGRLCVRPKLKHIIHCAVGFEKPLDVEAVKSAIQASVLLKHPRFCSILVHDRHGVEHWRKTSVNLDRHLIVIASPVSSSAANDDESAVNEYLADLSTGPELSTDKPLWEIHFLMAHRCVVFQVHHALADGTSLMSLLLSVFRKASDLKAAPTIAPLRRSTDDQRNRTVTAMAAAPLRKVGVLWDSLMFALKIVMRLFWVRDRKTAISGGDGVELWPRKIATARFCLEDMRIVKRAVGDATINDVLSGVISSGISKYLDHRTPKALQEGLQITGLTIVNLRKQPGLQEPSDLARNNPKLHWGNKFGGILLPIQYKKGGVDPLYHVRRIKVILERKKQCMEAHFAYKFGCNVMSYLGSKVAGVFSYRFFCNTSFLISNMVGPQEDVAIGDNPVTCIRVTSSSLPHALTMHMLSYAGRADMQVLVAKDIIPDPEFLAQCFEDALYEMKEAALDTVKPC
ncbi:O-acyltransferase WSD1 [Morus notabilis]|uniref:O-acyltransferase WSD1 n=1 Tax=Morus notabilis TaxID=981085 RepID=W9S670_9ROSA|nr:O-acyltransferase WSD1 [Morus notabilis]EXC17310.1 O-acyltransferase WSD1 [Morus notabilis]